MRCIGRRQTATRSRILFELPHWQQSTRLLKLATRGIVVESANQRSDECKAEDFKTCLLIGRHNKVSTRSKWHWHGQDLRNVGYSFGAPDISLKTDRFFGRFTSHSNSFSQLLSELASVFLDTRQFVEVLESRSMRHSKNFPCGKFLVIAYLDCARIRNAAKRKGGETWESPLEHHVFLCTWSSCIIMRPSTWCRV